MPQVALFPIPNSVNFPGVPCPLHVFEPRYRLVHFTSCGRPFLIAILTGADAAQRQRKAMQHLPWSEHYYGRRDDDGVTLDFIGEAQDVDVEPAEALEERSLRRLFQSGEIQDL